MKGWRREVNWRQKINRGEKKKKGVRKKGREERMRTMRRKGRVVKSLKVANE